MTTPIYKVQYAYFGWNVSGTADNNMSKITGTLQDYLDKHASATVLPVYPGSNNPFQDPAPGKSKSFTALIKVNNVDRLFAVCENCNLDLTTGATV